MKKLLIFLYFVFPLLKGVGFAQKKVDSLNILLKNAKHDTTRLRLYLALSDACDIKDNLKYAESAVQLADKLIVQTKGKQQTKIIQQKADLLNLYIVFYRNNGDTSKCAKYTNKRLSLYQEIKDTMKIFETMLDFGSYYNDIGNMPKSLEYYEKGLAIAKQKNDKKSISYSYFQMGVMCDDNFNTRLAIENFEKSVLICKELKDTIVAAWGLRKIGQCYSQLHNVPMALKYINEAIEMYKNRKDILGVMVSYGGIADVYKLNSDYKNAIIYYRQSLSIAQKQNDNSGIFRYINRMGNTYRDMGNYDSAFFYTMKGLKVAKEAKNEDGIWYSNFSLAKICFKQNKFKEAKTYIDPISKVTKKTFRREVVDIEQLAFKIDSANGNYEKALQHHLQYIMWRDKFNSDELSKHATKEKFQEQYDKQKAEQDKKNAIAAAEKRKQKIITWSVVIGLLLVLVFAGFVVRSLRVTRKQNQVIEKQKHLVEEHQKEIVDSITYAKRLQQAILPSDEEIKKYFPESFIYYQPKDIVAGDFYWMETASLQSEVGRKQEATSRESQVILIAAADSTGHGVPGAMVSVVCSNALNRAVKEFGLRNTGEILDKTRELVIETFEKSDKNVKDGMDISLMRIELPSHVSSSAVENSSIKVQWSGANNSLWYFQNNELTEIKANKQPIGKYNTPVPFTTHIKEFTSSVSFYLFSDGYADQFSSSDKKLMTKKFKEVLLSIQNLSMAEQGMHLEKFHKDWKGNMEQTDDVLVIGIKI